MNFVGLHTYSLSASMKQAMLVRSHICTAKRFFRRTMESFKSFLSKADGSSNSYRKLPKRTKRRIIAQACQESDGSGTRLKKAVPKRNKAAHHHHHQDMELCKKELRMRMVAKRLKEMEMVDKSNVDHLLDIEEVFHYYSRLTCPVYLDIVDRFFTELQAEFLGGEQHLKFDLAQGST